MAKKVSFPEHMRRLEAALNALLDECGHYDPVYSVTVTVTSDDLDGVRYDICASIIGGTDAEQRASEDVPEAAIRLLHDVAGTEPPPVLSA